MNEGNEDTYVQPENNEDKPDVPAAVNPSISRLLNEFHDELSGALKFLRTAINTLRTDVVSELTDMENRISALEQGHIAPASDHINIIATNEPAQVNEHGEPVTAEEKNHDKDGNPIGATTENAIDDNAQSAESSKDTQAD